MIKFQSILSDGSAKLTEIDGDEFAECDYGLLVDNSNNTELLSENGGYAQALIQNQMISILPIETLEWFIYCRYFKKC